MKNIAIVAIAICLANTICSMIKNNTVFNEVYVALHERKIKLMESSASMVKSVSNKNVKTFIENMKKKNTSG